MQLVPGGRSLTFRMKMRDLPATDLISLKPYFQQSWTSNVGMTLFLSPVVKVGAEPGYISNPDFSSKLVYPLDGSALNATTWDTWFEAGPDLGKIYSIWLRKIN